MMLIFAKTMCNVHNPASNFDKDPSEGNVTSEPSVGERGGDGRGRKSGKSCQPS